jgi:S-adenosylmethionine:tRNA ribosyltransferase-isomerase
VRIELFDYELPGALIAQEPAARRDESRLLVLDRSAAGDPVEQRFSDLPELLSAGDLLVVNDAMVDPVRLQARRATGGVVELLLLREVTDDAAAAQGPTATDGPEGGAGCGDRQGPVWEALVRPGRRVRPGDRLSLGGGEVHIVVRADLEDGRRLIELPADVSARRLFDAWGQMPLPPYIERRPGDPRAELDRHRYQTVYANAHGAVAAPTAGLHFTRGLLERIGAAGVEVATLTLRVGPGTFQPVRVDEVTEHRMEAEPYVLPPDCVAAIVAARRRGGRVVGVGTTVVRTLEHAARRHNGIDKAAGEGDADVFIYPGFEFQVIDAMLTNFHLPRSTPILMAAAVAGRERLLSAYRFAVRERFRFYSYGDAMLIL